MPRGVPSSLASLEAFLGSNPAAGSEISESVPAGRYWEVLAVAFTNVQGGAGTSLPDLVIDDGGSNVQYQAPCASSAQNTGVTARYFVAPGLTLGAGGAATRINSPLPTGLILGPGWRIKTVTAGLSANTDYGSPMILLIEYG